MSIVLGSLDHSLIYIDDILIYAKDFQQHLSRLKEILERLKQANLKLNPIKCSLANTQVTFLGHIITREGIRPDQGKILAVQEFMPPKNRKQVKSFLGLVGYFRRFIPDYTSLACPLYELTKESVRFKWTNIENSVFIELKNALMSVPVLAHPRFDREFLVYADASCYGVGAILCQKDDNGFERAISYMSRKLNQSQAR